MRIIRRVTYILLGIMKFLIIITLAGFFNWASGLFNNFGMSGILFSIVIGIIIVFHFFFVFPKKFRQIFPPIPFDDEITENKQKQATYEKLINDNKQKLIDACYWGEISAEEIDKRLDTIIWEKEILKECVNKYPAPSKKFTLSSPQSDFQRQNPVVYAVLILCAMFFACVLFFYYLCWVLSGYSPSEEIIPSDSYEYEIEPKVWMDMDDTVYISGTGKIHLYPDCSGMKDSDEMTYEEACEAGYSHCSRCFG